MLRKTTYLAVMMLTILSLQAYSQSKITSVDLARLIGSWEGTITYLDYQSNEPFTMPANLIVEEGRVHHTLLLKNIYPNEPKANNSTKLKLRKNGSFLNKRKVSKRDELSDGTLKIQTESKGKDGNKKALIRYTYQISPEHFSIKKEVQFEGNTKWIRRSEFNYNKVN